MDFLKETIVNQSKEVVTVNDLNDLLENYKEENRVIFEVSLISKNNYFQSYQVKFYEHKYRLLMFVKNNEVTKILLEEDYENGKYVPINLQNIKAFIDYSINYTKHVKWERTVNEKKRLMRENSLIGQMKKFFEENNYDFEVYWHRGLMYIKHKENILSFTLLERVVESVLSDLDRFKKYLDYYKPIMEIKRNLKIEKMFDGVKTVIEMTGED